MRSLTHGTERCGHGARRVTALVTLLLALLALPAAAGAAAPGGFTQLANPFGCLQNGGDGVTCGTAHDMSGPLQIAMSPDGKNVYATTSANTLMVLDRNPSTGVLTQKGGTEGCLINGAATATCKGATLLDGPWGVVVSPSGNAVYVAGRNSNAVLAFTRDPDGTLDQKGGLDACMADSNGLCRDARALNYPWGLSISPDGNSLYASSFNSNSVTAFDISDDGVLTQETDSGGFFGCVAAAAVDACQIGKAMSGALASVVAPDNSAVYSGNYGDGAISVLTRAGDGRIRMSLAATPCLDREGFAGCATVPDLGQVRDMVTNASGSRIYVGNQSGERIVVLDRQADGGIVRHAGDSGCVSEAAVAGCTDSRGIAQAFGVAIAPGGDHVYLASQGGGVVEERVDGGGGLAPRHDTRGCAAAFGIADCALGTGLSGPIDVEVSPDGKFIYSANNSGLSLAVFKRDSAAPSCSNGSATVAPGATVNLTLACADADGDGLTRTVLTPPALGNLGPVDQNTGQVTFASSGVPGTASFTFRSSASGVDSAPATFTINIVGTVPPPPPPPPPTLIASTVGNNWAAARTYTTVISLSAKRLPAGASVVVACKTKKKSQQKSRCPYKKKSFKAPAGKNQVNLAKQFRKKKLPVGTRITITITAPGLIGKKFVYTIRNRKIPKLKLTCLTPGSTTKSVSCG